MESTECEHPLDVKVFPEFPLIQTGHELQARKPIIGMMLWREKINDPNGPLIGPTEACE
jgi:hypothetical protein